MVLDMYDVAFFGDLKREIAFKDSLGCKFNIFLFYLVCICVCPWHVYGGQRTTSRSWLWLSGIELWILGLVVSVFT